MLSEFSLEGKVALVSGAGTPLGRAIATALAEAGADIAVVCGNAQHAEETASAVQAAGRRATVNILRPAMALSQEELRGIVSQTVADLGRIDILVNAHEMAHTRPFFDIGLEEWNQVMQSNLTSVFLWCQVVGQHLVSQGKGKVINLTSGLAERGIINCAAFSVAKAGVIQLTRSLAIEWARSGVNVNAIGLGWFAEQGFPVDPLVRFIPMRRAGTADEVGLLAVYLASDASDFVTGDTIFVDGGVLCHG